MCHSQDAGDMCIANVQETGQLGLIFSVTKTGNAVAQTEIWWSYTPPKGTPTIRNP